MLCKNPYMKGVVPFACGQCMPCRINRRRLWTHRMVLESYKHNTNSFVTLTYDDQNLPKDLSLDPKHAQDWLKRLRKSIEPSRVRYYLVGEYGDESQRPHYHAALFGVGREHAEVIQSTWNKGYTYTGDLTFQSAQYIGGYVTKKMTKLDDPRLEGRFPEFARMSNRPGIGAGAMSDLADQLKAGHGKDLVEEQGDVPPELQHGKKKYPLGRYLQSKLREELEIHDENGEIGKTPTQIRQSYTKEMQDLYASTGIAENGFPHKADQFKRILVNANKTRVQQIEARAKLYNKGDTL